MTSRRKAADRAGMTHTVILAAALTLAIDFGFGGHATAETGAPTIEGRLKYLADDFDPAKSFLFISAEPADSHIVNTDNVGDGPGQIDDPHRLQRRWQYNGALEVVYRVPNILDFNLVFWRFYTPQNPVTIAVEGSADNETYSPIDVVMLGAEENWKIEEISLRPRFDGDPDALRKVDGEFHYLKIIVDGGLSWHAQLGMVEILGHAKEQMAVGSVVPRNEHDVIG